MRLGKSFHPAFPVSTIYRKILLGLHVQTSHPGSHHCHVELTIQFKQWFLSFESDASEKCEALISISIRLALASVLGPFGVHFCTFVHSYSVHFIVNLSTL